MEAEMSRPRSSHHVSVVVAMVFAAQVAACSLGEARREIAGGASTSDKQVLDDGASPRRIYVADFTVEEGAIKPASGLISEAGELAAERPHLLGGAGGGIVGRRLGSDTPTADQVVNTLAASITEGLRQQNLGFPVQRLPLGAPVSGSGWVVNGRFVSVDPGNRAERAVVGFGAGQATTEVVVEVDRLGGEAPVPVLRFGTQADSGKMPGAAVTMNPYVAAAKFVLGKQATTRDVQEMGEEIAKQIGDYARSRRGAGAGTE
jgi:hypothetical protein